ncbi:MAG: ribonuclease P protein component [Candidatus Kapabacteria bacterium]|nr:ribonuclease P protein component [Candidatus Kapabacteria bacterium]
MFCRPLKGFGAFEETLRSGRRVTAGPLSLTAVTMAGSDEESASVMVGVTIAKRIAPRAVVRNRVKRLLREGVRRQVAERGDQLQARRISRLILNWRQAPTSVMRLHLADVETYIADAFDKLLRAPLHRGGA